MQQPNATHANKAIDVPSSMKQAFLSSNHANPKLRTQNSNIMSHITSSAVSHVDLVALSCWKSRILLTPDTVSTRTFAVQSPSVTTVNKSGHTERVSAGDGLSSPDTALPYNITLTETQTL